jgi:hypothetical protein
VLIKKGLHGSNLPIMGNNPPNAHVMLKCIWISPGLFFQGFNEKTEGSIHCALNRYHSLLMELSVDSVSIKSPGFITVHPLPTNHLPSMVSTAISM